MNLTEYHAKRDAEFLEFCGLPYPYNLPERQRFEIDPEETLVLSDPHVPYEDTDYIQEVLDGSRACRVLIPGDVMDYYSKSRFRKGKHEDFGSELRAGFRFLETLALRFPEVLIMRGNHDDRPEKQLKDLLPPDLLILTEKDVLAYMASFFPNVRLVGQELPHGLTVNHIFQLGDAIFTHAELSRMQRSATLERVSLQCHRWRDCWGLKPYRVIFQAHNHVAMSMPMGSEWWVSLPTCSDPYSVGMEYIYGPRMVGTPPNIGHVVLYQRDGVTDMKRTRVEVK